MNYFDKLKSPKWQKKRLQILQRDNFTCTSCGSTETELHVHHLMYDFKKEPWEIDNKLLTTFCTDCHKRRHDLEKLIKRVLSESMSNEKYNLIVGFVMDLCLMDIDEIEEVDDLASRYRSKKHNWNLFGENEKI